METSIHRHANMCSKGVTLVIALQFCAHLNPPFILILGVSMGAHNAFKRADPGPHLPFHWHSYSKSHLPLESDHLRTKSRIPQTSHWWSLLRDLGQSASYDTAYVRGVLLVVESNGQHFFTPLIFFFPYRQCLFHSTNENEFLRFQTKRRTRTIAVVVCNQ